jgi:chemotaxis response regulator CheB
VPENHDLTTRLDERVQRLQRDHENLFASMEQWRNEFARQREADEKERRRDRYTLIGIAVSLGGVAVAVLGLLNQL